MDESTCKNLFHFVLILILKVENFINQVHEHYHLKDRNSTLIDVSLLYLKTFKYQWKEAFTSLTNRTLKDLLSDHWTPKEVTCFEQSVIQFGLDLSLIKPLVSFFYSL